MPVSLARLKNLERHVGGATLGFGRIEPFRDGTWTPAQPGAGHVAWILDVLDQSGEAFDLLAWLTDDESRWWTRLGEAEVLGAANVEAARPHLGEAPTLPIWRTPAGWVRAGGEGAVLLRPDCTRELLWGAPAVVAEDRNHAQEICDALHRPWPDLPRILIPAGEAA